MAAFAGMSGGAAHAVCVCPVQRQQRQPARMYQTHCWVPVPGLVDEAAVLYLGERPMQLGDV